MTKAEFFGSFKLVRRRVRKGRNPRKGQEIQRPASKVVKFTPSKALKAFRAGQT